MGCYARCKSCNSNLYIAQQKETLPLPLQLTCNICFKQNFYLNYELTEERHDYSCSFCKKQFFIKRSPPLSILCPHCRSNIYINYDGTITVTLQGKLPDRSNDTVGGMIGGAAVGAIFGPEGAIIGGILGALLGNQGMSKEAIYTDVV